jgi:hypothetical protein
VNRQCEFRLAPQTRAGFSLIFCWILFESNTLFVTAGELQGRIVPDPDCRANRFRLQEEADTQYFHTTAETMLFRDGESVEINNLRYGDYVWVIGEQREDHEKSYLDARRIDVATVVFGRIKAIEKTTIDRLVVETDSQTRFIDLPENVVITNNKKRLNAGELRKNQYVWVASINQSNKLVARKIDVTSMMEGTIVSIMEIWPIRLSLKTNRGSVLVQLQEGTNIEKNSKRIDPGDLRNGDRIRVIGASADELVYAKEIIVEAMGRD